MIVVLGFPEEGLLGTSGCQERDYQHRSSNISYVWAKMLFIYG